MQGRATTRSAKAEEHWRLLCELDKLNLSDSCCDICHCDCYSSHRSSLDSEARYCVEPCQEKVDTRKSDCEVTDEAHETQTSIKSTAEHTSAVERTRSISIGGCKKRVKTKGTRRKNGAKTIITSNSHTTKPSTIQATTTTINLRSKSAKNSPTHSRHTSPVNRSGAVPKLRKSASTKRSKSVCSLRSRTPSPLLKSTIGAGVKRGAYYTRDCKILQELLSVLNDDEDSETAASLHVSGVSALKQAKASHSKSSPTLANVDTTDDHQSNTLPRYTAKAKSSKKSKDELFMTSLSSQKLCSSMASLCLAPTVRAAYQQVPAHDQRILNRMAHKRSERALAKENAWLARKYWENERYERELFKCAQMEEYKRAIRDKQFQDYLLTKARLNEIAQRDLSELHRLREALQQKDRSTKRRLDALRVERGIAACQRRCDELRRAEAVTVQQEEQQIDEKMRKQEICTRLSERLERAEQIRANMLDSYLRRLRYDNYMEELVHEEHLREAQQLERQRLEQLEEHIKLKCEQSQRFIETRQRRQEAIAKTAKISASLRELVRNSVTPEGGAAPVGTDVGDAVSLANTATLSKVLLDRPYSKLSLHP
ncbi:uncharacterized protein LOC101463207 [Ceratitis capitata]|uniref:uncharacterized protein LOC101463207 n=1 Tax=Ceratitis capitata TaxID=7213 RepID=UPI00061882A0|nr:uncharacterized protein LOC101463207 [Ceratitis capitata]